MGKETQGGCGRWDIGSKACSQRLATAESGLRELAGGPFLSPAYYPLKEGWEGARGHFLLLRGQSPPRGAPLEYRASPCGAGLPVGQPACHPIQSGLCAQTRKGLVIQTVGRGAPIWPGL